MTKLLAILCIIGIASSFQIFGIKFFEEDFEYAPQYTQLSDAQEERLHADDQIHMGTAITPEIQLKIKSIAERAYAFNGPDQIKNMLFIQQQLNILYNGTYVVAIFGGASYPEFGKNIGISSFSANGEWWIYWRGANHYMPYYGYYISRQEGSSSTYKCETSNFYPYYNSSSTVFYNVINAAEMDYNGIQNFTAEVQSYLNDYSPEQSPTVVAVNGSVPFYICVWKTMDQNYIQRTYRFELTVLSMPRI